MDLPVKEFDLVVSLGGNCSVAGQLRMRGLRHFSLPFDWTLMRDVQPVEYLPEGLRTKFKDFCRYENLSEYENAAFEYGKYTLRVRDRATGFCFIHHFHHPLGDRVAFEKDRAVLENRIARLYQRMSQARSALFVLETSFEFDPELLVRIQNALREVFSATDVYLAAMQFSAGEASSAALGDHVFLDRHKRKVNVVYDNQFTGTEWCWMDSLSIIGRPTAAQVRRSSLWTKWKYKLWSSLGKSLRDGGAGCANMRFRKFDSYDI